MAPSRTMTGDTFLDEKMPQSPTSPTSTDSTLRGDAFIEIGELNAPCSELSPDVRPSSAGDAAQPVENAPNGFPRLAAFQASDPNFGLYRSYSYLHSRILLDYQSEITELEEELDQCDWDEVDEDEDRPRFRAAEGAEGVRDRRAILRDIKAKLMEYDEVLIKVRTLESFQRPSERDYRSVRRYHNNTKPLMDGEMESIRCKEDVVSISTGRERAAFDGGVETFIGQVDSTLKKIFNLKQGPLVRYFRTPELAAKTENTDVSLYSATRIDKMVNIFITFVIFILLVIPIIGVLIVFTLLFSAAMSVLTKAARHEMFAASAAYCAILVVFIGNFTGPNN
ncbi:hypothetical protein N0V91_005438 [Didymella pomorum]|uniref:DUF6594 domain-containing protein n=1 Tax=Didymella pomorum TaxID=749634 RepID=A0A9W8ZCS9_9PLEO|nr:hypothetical protein N0V91_005438 [Didymella pomorum]